MITETRPHCSRLAGREAIARVTARAHENNVSLVWFLYADHGGIIRGKAATAPMLPARIVTGIGHTVAMMAMSMLDQLQPVDGMGPVGEVRIMPDPATFVPLPYAPGAGAMLADQVLPSGEPWDGCARTYLKQAIAAAAADGYAATAAFEPEFTLGRREADPDGGPDRLVPNDDSLCYSATGFHLAHDFTMDLLGALTAQGLRPEHYYPELGHGQQEMTIRHAPALRAADNHVLYREAVRGTAFRRGLWASLAPKPIPDQAGNGAHLHISLRDLGPAGEPGRPGVLRPRRPVQPVRDRVPLHRRPARAPARAGRADLRVASTATGGSRRRCGAAPTPSTAWTTGRRRSGSARRCATTGPRR